MELSRQEYPSLLSSLQPGQAVTLLNDRVRLIGKVNIDIADWLQERRRVEEVYVQGLKKLAGRRQQDGASELGVFQMPWQTIVSSTESLAASHSMLAQKIEADVEKPLKDFSMRSREILAMGTVQSNLAAMAKEIEVAQKKVDKLRDKGGKASAGKVANATSDLESATQQWESQAPFIFERLQALDEGRLNHLRDVLTQLETHEVDQVERNRQTAESCLNVLLNVETADEIKAFSIRAAGGRPGVAPRQKSKGAAGGTLSPPPTGTVDDGASERSGTSAAGGRPGSSQEQRHGGLGGLKRLGTVIGRRRQSTQPSPQSSGRPSSPDKRTLGSFSSPFRRGDSSRSTATVPSPGASTQNLPSSPSREGATLPRTAVVPLSLGDERRSNEQTNGDATAPNSSLTPNEGVINGVRGLNDVAPQQGTETGPSPHSSAVRDADGFTIPPSTIDEISRAEQDATANDIDAPQFKLDIRNEPIQEEDVDAQAALNNVANTLRVQAQQIAPIRKPGSTRGRRDVRNTIFVPSPQSFEPAAAETSALPPPSQIRTGRTGNLSSEDHTGSDTQSIRSSHSLSSMGSGLVKHPDLNQPGLNASIVETVSAWFLNGQVTKAIMIGELALAYNSTNTSPPPSTEGIRLENFSVLEKVAPNTAFITQVPERSGEYVATLSSLARTAVAFKYQVHLEEVTLPSHAPMVLTTTWKIENQQASVILGYAFNPAFASAAKRNVSMRNVTIGVALEGAKATICQSKPVGTFSKEKSMIYWKLGDITLDQYDSGPHKLLARFSTETEAKPGNVEARWEISGEDAIGLGSGLSISHQDHSVEGVREEGLDPFADEGVTPTTSALWKEIPVVAASRIATTQPTYDFLTGGSASPPQNAFRQTFRQSQASKPDIGNEEFRAQIKTLQYELETMKQERELNTVHHAKELRDLQTKAEVEYKRAQTSESNAHITSRKYGALAKELQELQDNAMNQKNDLERKLRNLEEQNQSLREDVDEGKMELSSIDRQYTRQLQEVETKHSALLDTLGKLRDDLSNKSAELTTTQQRLSQRENEVGSLESEVLRLKAQTGDADTLAVIKRELSEQVTHIKKLESTNRNQAMELKQFRRTHKAVELVEEEKRVLERKLRAIDDLRTELGEAQLQRQILEDERKAWTSYLQSEGSINGGLEFDSPEALARAVVQERIENASLLGKLGAVEPELLEKDELIKGLEADLSRLQGEVEKLRTGGGSRDSRIRTRLERQRALAVKEVEYLRAQLKTFDTEETTYQPEHLFDEQKTKQVQELEALVDEYRKELQTLHEELAKQGDGPVVPEGAGTKRPREDEADDRLGQLSRKNRKLQDEIARLQQTSALLQKELQVSKTQLTSLQQTSRTRILELRSNPTTDHEAVKLSTLDTLRAENKALLAKLEGQSYNIDTVPVSTLHSVRLEIHDLERTVASKEKLMKRMKEIWSAKFLEFREAVFSILGWQMEFMPNGKFRVTSMYYPAEEEGDGSNSLIFDGETGSFNTSGGPDSRFGMEIRGLVDFWVMQKKEIPCFLAAMSLEFYDRTTKAARM